MSDSANSPTLAQRPHARSLARRIVMPLIILVVAGVLLYMGRQQEVRHEDEVRIAVRELLDEIADSPVQRPTGGPVAQRLNVTAGTLERLARVLIAHPPGTPGFELRIETGDADPPYGDDSATHRAYIFVHGIPEIALRLRHDGAAHRIEVLGYWTP